VLYVPELRAPVLEFDDDARRAATSTAAVDTGDLVTS
jgi:hypothetical protein